MSQAKIVGKIDPEVISRDFYKLREKPILTATPLKVKLGDFVKTPIKVKK